ncbi:MAG: MotA/TolQ/ExbB proton channel family protein [Chitinophagales bacterium]|nr:MotA/TolQ/ExbB proton channel family protein [Chitinophagales bacterium]
MDKIYKHLGVAILVILLFSIILTIGLLTIIDISTFDWQSERFEEELKKAIIDKSQSFQIEDIDINGCFLYKEASNQEIKLCPSVEKKDESVFININTIRLNDTISYQLAESSYHFFLGRSTLIGKGESIRSQVFRLGYELNKLEENEAREDSAKSGFRWLQSVIEVLKASSRMNTRLVGWVQLMIYLFSMIAVALMIVDISFVKKNQKVFRNIDFLKSKVNYLPEINLQEIEEVKDDIKAGLQQFSFHRSFEPPIVYDSLKPSLDMLSTYKSGNVNRGELLQSVNTICEGVENRLERRFQVLRYFVMTIPSLGFIGTIIGISEALGLTSRLTGDSPNYEKIFANESLGQSLNVAFDTTLVGLIASILLSFFIDWLESWELNFTNIVRENIINRLSPIKKVVE